ncbi:gamma-tubulin complex component 6 [Leguminivora glycinivorella]|uniref:gamma-tubulin complex component 6 n=1 Tax=Leguminivora glycinivorella TaxID=1035111 RepID=UPI00200E5B2D|nr:gamma-tubulin complex component 6 [Leguminivora glycinivorella]
MASSVERRDDGVYQLLTELCAKTASKYGDHSKISEKHLVALMRSHSYGIILGKSSKKVPDTKVEPVAQLWSYYFISKQNVKNIAEHKRAVELKSVISKLRNTDFGDSQENIMRVLKCLLCLKNSVNVEYSQEIYKNPFTFGTFDDMLPKPPRESFGSPEPYHYYPSHVFVLPFALKSQGNVLYQQKSEEYTVENYGSSSFLLGRSTTQTSSETKKFVNPISIPSMTSMDFSPYDSGNICNFPRLTGQRDLQIPKSSDSQTVKISLPDSSQQLDILEPQNVLSDNIWEVASRIDKDIPEDIWEIVSKMPPVNERRLIATSTREVGLWRREYSGRLCDLDIVLERQFIRHVMYLIIGVETTSFPFSQDFNCFNIKENLALEGISVAHLKGYVKDLLLIGTYYKRLYQFAFNHSVEDHFRSKGLVYEAAREIVRRYLLNFRLTATAIYEECTGNTQQCLPTLLQILHHMEPLKYEIETVASIYKMINHDSKTTIPNGAELMSYLFNEISLVTHTKTAATMFSALFSVCRVYFRFIERFIFEGELDDWYNEFFIKKDSQYANSRSKRYWDKGFHITQSVAVPEFLRVLAKLILLCGKSLRLLKLCNPNDPLVLLISSDHPSIKCCATFPALSRQQQLLDVYRTRCLFVSGEPVTFPQLLLKKEAERKAATEMSALKQAETLEKIVAERKRLAQLIAAEKQHSLRVLEAAMAEAKEAKTKARERERNRFRAETQLEKATDHVDAKLRDDERNKIMEYYSKLNLQVEKSKIHTEWKIKRLQLDQSRMQLLSTEERNLKREKLELEHQQKDKTDNEITEKASVDGSGDACEQSCKDKQSTESISVGDDVFNECTPTLDDTDKQESALEKMSTPMTESTSSIVMTDLTENQEFDANKAKSMSSSDVFSAICNAAKNIFSLRSSDDKECDNKKPLDAQGNVVTDGLTTKKSSEVIGANLDNVHDNEQYLKMREEALKNKQKVMLNEFGQTDQENNRLKAPVQNTLDEENNINTLFAEAKRNKLKVLGAEFDLNPNEVKQVVAEPRTDAQKQALINKQKVLGVEYNLPTEIIKRNEPANKAQEEAVQNRDKMLGSDFDAPSLSARREKGERAGLTLNLKPYSEISMATYTIPTPSNVNTPGEFPQLDLETPTTADIPLGAMTSDVFTPRSETGNIDSARVPSDKEFLRADGFDFSLLVDEDAESEEPTLENDDDFNTSVINPHYSVTDSFKPKRSIFNLLEGTYNLDDFDPFGTRDVKKYNKDYFNNKMSVEASDSCYTHPAITFEETKKKPYANIFASNFVEDTEEITCDNIATLTACLQRSVMLPLTYQLEVVNNAMLTHFLVNLDMYEHLRSLKDYFFLMDGEFSSSICRNLFTKLTKTVNPQELLNFSTLHNILDKALGSSITHVHKFSENLSFTITESPLSFQHTSPDVLQCLSLTYAVSWPLNIIMSQDALLRYAKVFQFLIKMRRIFWTLGEDFQALKLAVKVSKQQSRRLLGSPQYISIQLYRHIMSSFVRALDNYIVTTCILSSWTEFENDLKKARTLDDLYDCHVVYIKKVLFRCLLNNRSTPVMKLLNDIFTVILKFSRVLKAGKWLQKEQEGPFTHTSFAQLVELFHMFEKLAKYLHKVITKLMECGYQRHLAELLIMVNLNQYYDSEKKDEQNSSIVSNT